MLAILVSLSSFLKLLHTNETSGFIIFNGRQSIVGFKSETQIIEIISETDVEQDGSRHADYNRFKKVHWDGLKHCTIKADASKNLLFTFFNTKGGKKQTLYLAVFPHPEKADFEKMLNKFRPCVCVISADRLRTWDKARITEEIKSKTGRSPMFYKTATRGLVWHQK
jgi:hypothetical protein